MEVVEFRFIRLDEPYDKKYVAWSRVYEYPLVLKKLAELGANSRSLIHNSAWGFAGCHITFKNDLNTAYPQTVHSDVKSSDLPNTFLYDITKPPIENMKNVFDFVINISTIEEVGHNNVAIIRNLFDQVKPGGYLVITFDYHTRTDQPGNGSIQLENVENFLGRKIDPCEYSARINGDLSVCPEHMWNFLNCGLLILKKTSA
jgi:SAM-dependent methyltransferase